MANAKQEKAGGNKESTPEPVRIETRGRDAIWSERMQSKQTQEVGLMNGEQILWVNPLDWDCTLVFDRDGCPFDHHHRRCELVVPARGEALSDVVCGKVKKSYGFTVHFPKKTAKDGRGTPKIIIQG